jgi:hypothetical protein
VNRDDVLVRLEERADVFGPGRIRVRRVEAPEGFGGEIVGRGVKVACDVGSAQENVNLDGSVYRELQRTASTLSPR